MVAGGVGLNRAGAGLALAGVVAVVGAGAIVAVERHRDAQHDAAVHRVTEGASDILESRIDRISQRAGLYQSQLRRTPLDESPAFVTSAASSDFRDVALAAPAVPLRIIDAGLLGGRDTLGTAASSNAVLAAASAARDTAMPLAAVIDSPTHDRLFVVAWPRYRGHPTTTADRRAASVGWVLGVVPMSDVIDPVVRISEGFGGRVGVSSTLAGPGEVDTVLDDATTLQVNGAPGQSPVPAFVIGALTLIACALLIVYDVRLRRRVAKADKTNTALSRRLSLISNISVTVQESLDMGLVLPTVLALMSESLSLSYISVVPGPSESRLEMLSIGRRPTAMPGQRWSPDSSTAGPGQYVRIPLRRANRTLGHLEVAPTHGLDAVELASLRSTADLLAGALYNADLYEREQESVRRLRELDELKDDFLATVSHELRTPLSVLVGFISLLARDWDRIPEQVRRESIQKMERHVGSLTNLVNDLLDFISDRRAKTADCGPVELDDKIGELIETVRPLCHEHELVVDVPGPVTAWTDPRALERILGNLVGNAAKYSERGSTIRVQLTGGSDPCLIVTDEGPGIREEDRNRIFERFYRGDSDAARSTRGSGIGLAVVLAWVRAIGGRLDIASRPGVGTAFIIHFATSAEEPLDGAGSVTWLDHSPAPVAEEIVQ